MTRNPGNEYQSNFIFVAKSREGFSSVGIMVLQNIYEPLEHSANAYIYELARFRGAKNSRVIYDKEIKLGNASPAREAELEWTDNSGIIMKGFFLVVKKDNSWIIVEVDNNGTIDDKLKKIAYSLKLKPEEKIGIPYKYQVPEQTDDGWQTAHIDQVKIDEKKLTDLIGKIQNGTFVNIHGILIIKNGKLVFEKYFPGQDLTKNFTPFTRDDLHLCASVTKSFTSTLIGIAIDNGIIKGLDKELIAFFPEYKKELSTGNKSRITFKDVLSMTSGLEWDEWTYTIFDTRNSLWMMQSSENIISYILTRPVKDEPGKKFTYNGGLSVLLGVILEKETSMKLNEFARQYFFNPLGISKYEWGYLDNDGMIPATEGGLYLRPRDMAKLGYLYLRKGIWNEKRIVSSNWIEEATSEHIKLPYWGVQTGYGYQWWLYKFWINNKLIEGYSAVGWGGQHIFVFPGLDTVIVLTGGNYFLPQNFITNRIMNTYILPAIVNPE